MQLELRVPGEKARFHCDLGWSRVGGTNITCDSSGAWQGTVPHCRPTTCLLPSQTSANLVSRPDGDAEVGSQLTYNCEDGRLLLGSSTLTCLPNGLWDLEPPACVKPECSTLVEVDNGVILA